MPNPSNNDRIMVVVAYQSSWFPRDRKFLAPLSAKPLLTGNPKVVPLATFLPDGEYLEVFQKFAPGEPMYRRYGPDPTHCTTINDVAVEDRYIRGSGVAKKET